MSIFEDTNPRELKKLLEQIHDREAALPDFQRDFVWDPSATQELIVSIASNYPAGSLLRIKNTNNYFAYREFEGAPELDGTNVTYLVLDGQQRLTSLYQAFYGVGEHRYFLDLKVLIANGDFEEAIFHGPANSKDMQKLQGFDVQAEELVLPLAILRGGSGDYLTWVLRVARRLDGDERNRLEDALTAINNQWIKTIDDYLFPVVTLSDTTSAEAICTIFETLNRTGVKLTAFELLTARFWPKNVNLRHLWEKALQESPILEDYDVDPYYVLQVVGMISKPVPGCKRSEVLNLKTEDVNENWDKAVESLASSLKMLRDDCGVLAPKWLPYSTILIPIASVLAKLGLAGPAVGAARKMLARWFWCATLSQDYDNAANTKAARDMTQLIDWIKGSGKAPETVETFRFDPAALADTTHRQRALYRGLMCLVVSRGTRDFYSYQKLSPELLSEEGIEDHDIFPRAHLDKMGVSSRLRDSILNRTLIDRDTNRRISDRPPSRYMAEIRAEYKKSDRASESFEKLIGSHQLPTGSDSPLWSDDFTEFVKWRTDALWHLIRDATDIKNPSQLVDTEGEKIRAELIALGERADAGDKAAERQLEEMAKDAGIDPDDYYTWREVADELASVGREEVTA